MNDLGYQVLESNHVRTNRNGVSCGAKLRAKELEELYNNEDVKVIICATGGEFLLEMLSFLIFLVYKKILMVTRIFRSYGITFYYYYWL